MVSIGCIANNKLPLYKTITIDINKLGRNLTNLQITSISECAINTTAQPVNDQNIILLLETNKSMKQKMRNLLLMKLAKTQKDEQEEETDGPLNEHIELQLRKHVYKQ